MKACKMVEKCLGLYFEKCPSQNVKKSYICKSYKQINPKIKEIT